MSSSAGGGSSEGGGDGEAAGEVVGQVEVLARQMRGELVVSLRRDVWRRAAEEMRGALVLRPLLARCPNIQTVASTLKKAWRVQNGVKFMEISNERLVVKFENAAVLRRVLEGGPWTLEGWVEGCRPKEMSLRKQKIWVQIYYIPLHLVEEGAAVEIAGVIGKVCGSSEQDQGDVARRRFARFRVEVDVDEPLKGGFFLEQPDGEPLWLCFKYKRLPLFCHRCGVLSHDTRSCNERRPLEYGRWLRADNDEMRGLRGEGEEGEAVGMMGAEAEETSGGGRDEERGSGDVEGTDTTGVGGVGEESEECTDDVRNVGALGTAGSGRGADILQVQNSGEFGSLQAQMSVCMNTPRGGTEGNVGRKDKGKEIIGAVRKRGDRCQQLGMIVSVGR